MPRHGRLLLIASAVAPLSACFTTTADFRSDAERYIETAVAEEMEVEFVAVECAEPLSQDVGTRFACTATDSDGNEWVFDNEITAENEFTVNLDRSP